MYTYSTSRCRTLQQIGGCCPVPRHGIESVVHLAGGEGRMSCLHACLLDSSAHPSEQAFFSLSTSVPLPPSASRAGAVACAWMYVMYSADLIHMLGK